MKLIPRNYHNKEVLKKTDIFTKSVDISVFN